MRDPNRIPKILKQVEDLWKRVPDWRLGQLFCNLQRFEQTDLFFYEDKDLIEALESYLGNKKLDRP